MDVATLSAWGSGRKSPSFEGQLWTRGPLSKQQRATGETPSRVQPKSQILTEHSAVLGSMIDIYDNTGTVFH